MKDEERIYFKKTDLKNENVYKKKYSFTGY